MDSRRQDQKRSIFGQETGTRTLERIPKVLVESEHTFSHAPHDMVLIDSFRLTRQRGTFMNLNGIQKDWNELDVAMVGLRKSSEHVQLSTHDRHGLG